MKKGGGVETGGVRQRNANTYSYVSVFAGFLIA